MRFNDDQSSTPKKNICYILFVRKSRGTPEVNRETSMCLYLNSVSFQIVSLPRKKRQ